MNRRLDRALSYINVILFFLLILAMGFFSHNPPGMRGWEYKDVASLLLTVVTVVLAALAIILALAAVWGYQKITEHAAERADKVARETSLNALDTDEFQARLLVLVSEEYRRQEMQQVTTNVSLKPEVTRKPKSTAKASPDSPWKDEG